MKLSKKLFAILLSLLVVLTVFPLGVMAEQAEVSAQTVASVTITGKATVAAGKTLKLKATILPTELKKTKLLWASSDSSIASVNQKGVVKGLKKGDVEITATAQDSGAVAGRYAVTVVPVIKSIKINSSGTYLLAGKTMELTATVLDSKKNDLTADAQLVWSSSAPAVASVNDKGVVTANSSGKATITASYGGKTGKLKLTVEVPKPLAISSTGIKNGVLQDSYGDRGSQKSGMIPTLSPQLKIDNLPKGAKAIAIYCVDPDGGYWTHWLAANIPTGGKTSVTIAENASISMASSIVQGRNDFGTVGYGGPTPPSGTHRYIFKVYALSDNAVLSPSFSKGQLDAAIRDITLISGEITGTYAR